MNTTERKIPQYRVFGIYAQPPDEDPIIYIGISRMKDLRKLFRYYRNESEMARPLFEPGVSAEIILLENHYMPVELAYRYCLAWMRYFLEREWDVIGRRKSYEAAFSLYEETEKIYHTISETPIAAVFSKDQTMQELMPAQKPTEKPVNKPKELLDDRVSIRVTKQEHNAFERLCRSKSMTQRELFQMLLAQMSECDDLTAEIICKQNRQIDELRDEIASLTEKIRSIRDNDKLRSAFQFLQKGILEYIYTCNDMKAISGQPLRCLAWKEFVCDFPDRKTYQYPAEDTIFRFKLQQMCYGHGPCAPVFLYGANCDTGERVKLRFYPRNEYAGARPVASPYFRENACFLAGGRRLYPDVTEMMFAFPLPMQKDAVLNKPEQFSEIDKLLRDATLRSRYSE